jgi:hypothetical protein
MTEIAIFVGARETAETNKPSLGEATCKFASNFQDLNVDFALKAGAVIW